MVAQRVVVSVFCEGPAAFSVSVNDASYLRRE